MRVSFFLGLTLGIDVLPEGSRIVHGQLAETPEQYSFLVSIRLEYMPTNSLCAGALINSRTVVTAAHCNETDSIDRLVAYHGIYDFSDLEKVDASDPIRVVAFMQHPQYNPQTYFNDGRPAPIQVPIPLDSGEIGNDFLHPVRVIGWGRFGRGLVTSTQLRKADLQVADVNICQLYMKWLVDVPVDPNIHVCALQIGGQADACQGDSGGPLIARVCGQWILVGIVSFGQSCGLATAPGIYTRVSAFPSFIKEHTLPDMSAKLRNHRSLEISTRTNLV